MNRRDLLRLAAVTGAATALSSAHAAPKAAPVAGPLVISSGNGVRVVAKAGEIIAGGGDPLDAVIAGVNILEDDPDDMTVGYGGIPNEEGVVQLDASVMDGRTMKSGAVGALERVRHPSRVARLVMERTDRAFLVGAGALKFAVAHGFTDENLLTPRARKVWLHWRETLATHDDWNESTVIDPDVKWFIEKYGPDNFRPQGTVHCAARTTSGDFAGVTTTSGLFFKMPGRLGDSPVIGAGLYLDNDIGSCGSTGWGEANIRSCGSHTVIEYLRAGKSPKDAALETLARIQHITKDTRFLDAKGRVKNNVTFYVIAKDGRVGAASMWKGNKYQLHGGGAVKEVACDFLHEA